MQLIHNACNEFDHEAYKLYEKLNKKEIIYVSNFAHTSKASELVKKASADEMWGLSSLLKKSDSNDESFILPNFGYIFLWLGEKIIGLASIGMSCHEYSENEDREEFIQITHKDFTASEASALLSINSVYLLPKYRGKGASNILASYIAETFLSNFLLPFFMSSPENIKHELNITQQSDYMTLEGEIFNQNIYYRLDSDLAFYQRFHDIKFNLSLDAGY